MAFAAQPTSAHAQEDSSRVLAGALVVALLVHVAVLLVTHRAPSAAPLPVVATALEYTLEEGVVPPSVPAASDEQQRASAEEARVASVARLTPGARSVAPGAAGAATEAMVGTTSSSAEPSRVQAPPGDQGTWSMPVTTAAPNLGLNRSAFQNGLIAATPDALGAPASSAVQRSVLRPGLTAHDQDIGMARGGIVTTAAHDAVFPSLVPDESFALVEVRFDGAGHAVSARVVESQNDRGSWNEAAQAMVSQMGDRAVRLPEHAAGLSVFVRIDVSLRLPSGAKGAISQSGAGIAGDLSDIGQSKKRHVAARIVSETLL